MPLAACQLPMRSTGPMAAHSSFAPTPSGKGSRPLLAIGAALEGQAIDQVAETDAEVAHRLHRAVVELVIRLGHHDHG